MTARLVFAAALAALVSLLAGWRGALTASGALGATIVGAVALGLGGPSFAAALLAFFTSSSLLSRLGQRRKAGTGVEAAKGARRDLGQVLANGGVATLAIALQHGRDVPRLRAAALGALAAAGADTWATELGLLSPTPPRLITTLCPVPPGTSGGVTALGLAASAGGALLVGLSFAAARGLPIGPATRIALAGCLAGALADSLLGATLQVRYRCPRCARLTEARRHRCGTLTERVGGVGWIDNDLVNAGATATGAAVAALVWRTADAARTGR